MTHTYPRLVTSRHTHTSPVPHGTCIASHTLASCHRRRGWCRSICLVLTRQNVSAVLPRCLPLLLLLCLPLLLLLCSVGVGVRAIHVRAIDVRVVQCAACLQNPLCVCVCVCVCVCMCVCVCVCVRERERERERARERSLNQLVLFRTHTLAHAHLHALSKSRART
jgi:hypothetical protein